MIDLEFVYLLLVLNNIRDILIITGIFGISGMFFACTICDEVAPYLFKKITAHKIFFSILVILFILCLILIPSYEELIKMYVTYLSQHNNLTPEDIQNITNYLLSCIK